MLYWCKINMNKYERISKRKKVFTFLNFFALVLNFKTEQRKPNEFKKFSYFHIAAASLAVLKKQNPAQCCTLHRLLCLGYKQPLK